MFYDFSKAEGNWSSRGCEVLSVEGDVVVCGCSHLTNFGVLVVSIITQLRIFTNYYCYGAMHDHVVNVITYLLCIIIAISVDVTLQTTCM